MVTNEKKELAPELQGVLVRAGYRVAAGPLLAAEKSFRRIMGYRDLWMLEAALGEDVDDTEKAA